MKKLLMIPDRYHLEADVELVKKYSLGYEYNDFFNPSVLDNKNEQAEIVKGYRDTYLPQHSTLHGAFFDVIPFSLDEKIKEISMLRIEQSISAAQKLGASAVIFHTNYNPFLNSPSYINEWISQNENIWSGILDKHPDISVFLENMFDTTPDIMEELSSRLCRHQNYGVCLDYAHAALSKVAPLGWAKRLGKYVKHVHINDNDLVSDLHLAWGDGKIDRHVFYEAYERYMNGATVLVETSSYENKKRSLEMLVKEGFISV